MSVRKHEYEIDIAASPEEIWRALTEADGICRWFAPVADVKPGLGGTITLSWGEGCEGTAPIHLWEPGKRFGWTEGAKLVEFEIEAVDGGATRLRLVHSGFGAEASLDQEYDSTQGGWQTFLAMLRHSAERFAGVPASHVHLLGVLPVPVAVQWARLVGPAGLAIDSLAEGGPYRAQIGGVTIAGTVLRHPGVGYLSLATPDSIVACFVEKSGASSMQTIQWILFGEARARVGEIREALTRFTDGLAAPGAAAE